MDNSLSGYIIEPYSNREGCKVFYANITGASDIPFWAFKRFCQEKVIGVFERILSRMATFDLKNEDEIKVINTYSNIEPSFQDEMINLREPLKSKEEKGEREDKKDEKESEEKEEEGDDFESAQENSYIEEANNNSLFENSTELDPRKIRAK